MFPDIGIAVLSKTLVIKAVYLSDLTTFVVSPKDGDSIPVSDLQGHKEGDRLQGIISSVHVITHEQIVGFWALAADSEEFGQVIELPVNVPAHCDWCDYRLHIRFFLQDFFCLYGGKVTIGKHEQ